MRLERKNEEELARRKGMSTRTIIQTIWLSISIAVGYFIARLLFANGVMSPNVFRDVIVDFMRAVFRQSISRGDIPVWVGWAIFIFLIVVVMQFFFLMGFALVSAEGRRKSGTPSLHSRVKDPFDDRY